MTIPAEFYKNDKVAEDFKASKRSIDTDAIIGHALAEGRKVGKGFFAQASEYIKLLRSPGGLDFPDYFAYRLFDDSKLDFKDKQRFVSDRFYFKIIDKCSDKRWWILADDKYWADSILRAHGFPVAKTQAVFCQPERQFGEIPTLSDEKSLAQFLARDAQFPIYAKPINGVASLGNFLIEGYRDDSVILAGGESVPVADFAQQLEQSIGQLFQSVLLSNESLSDVCGRVSTIRVILIIRNGEVKILSTIWKIPSAANIADNFWRVGNRIASVDSATGTVERAVAYVDNIPTEIEPDSTAGAALVGRQLPDWEDVLDICRRGAHLFAGLRFQGWDIALSDRGPVVVEINPGSSFILSQIASGRGFLTDEFYEFVESCGYPLKPFK
jgi:hypothetical protein